MCQMKNGKLLRLLFQLNYKDATAFLVIEIADNLLKREVELVK